MSIHTPTMTVGPQVRPVGNKQPLDNIGILHLVFEHLYRQRPAPGNASSGKALAQGDLARCMAVCSVSRRAFGKSTGS